MKLITVGFLIVLIGILVILAGVLSIAYQSWKTGCVEKPEEGVRGGGVIMIGPIPIIFGTDVGALKIVMILAIVLMAIAVILMLLSLRVA
ncbi:MAG: TIGR00304 family membrane protein [Candidatus Methanospirareceae archaeon]